MQSVGCTYRIERKFGSMEHEDSIYYTILYRRLSSAGADHFGSHRYINDDHGRG